MIARPYCAFVLIRAEDTALITIIVLPVEGYVSQWLTWAEGEPIKGEHIFTCVRGYKLPAPRLAEFQSVIEAPWSGATVQHYLAAAADCGIVRAVARAELIVQSDACVRPLLQVNVIDLNLAQR